MFKTALFDCVINEKCCSVDGGRGICCLFSSPPWGIWQLKSPLPQEFAIQGPKNTNARGSAPGGGGGGGGPREFTVALFYQVENISFYPSIRIGVGKGWPSSLRKSALNLCLLLIVHTNLKIF